MTVRIVFMGSPEFAEPILRKLAQRFQVVGVVTQPDRPAGRGKRLTPPPIKLVADELHLPAIQPHKLSEPAAFSQLQEWAPDLIVVAAFGQILRSAVLDLPKYRCVNVHASLLPRWRGAAPVNAAILNGDSVTGITIMLMDEGIDTGPILSQKSIPLALQATTGSLSAELSRVGADLLLETLPGYLEGNIVPSAQDGSKASYAPMLKKDEALLDFSKAAHELERAVRAFNPWPGAFTYLDGQILKVHAAHVVEVESSVPGNRFIYQGLPAVETGTGILVLDKLQLAGRKVQAGNIFLQGIRDWESSQG